MIVFWIVAAVLILLALALVLPTLLRNRAASPAAALGAPSASRSNLSILREQLAQLDAELASDSIGVEQHRLARGEIERRVLDEEAVVEGPRKAGSARRTALAIGALIPVFVLGAYAVKGNLAALDPQATRAPDGHSSEINMAQIEEMVDKLAKRLESQTAPQPDDVQRWTMLARSYSFLQRLPEASRAYSRAIALAPNDAQLLADHADVLGGLQGRRLDGEPMRLVERALQIDPNNPKALALAGTAAFDRKDFAGAVAFWSKARQVVPAESDFAKGLDGSIAEAKLAAQGAGAATAAAGTAPVVTAAAATATGSSGQAAAPAPVTGPAGAQITGRVSLSPALAARAAPSDTVFVFARAMEGPRMPLAIVRRTVADLPVTFTLDDSMAMSPQMKLSNFPVVVVGARITKSGNAMAQPGDLQGQAAPIKIGSRGVELVIDSVQP